jgi:large subunit ribosomal protein L19
MTKVTANTSPVNMEERKTLDMKSGDTVKVYQKIQEKGKTRLQMFEGMVLARKHGKEAGATFTVRRVSGGYGVEKIFPLYSPLIDKIEVTKRAKVRRSKLYYVRRKAAKEISKRMKMEMLRTDTPEAEETKETKE